MYLKEYTRPIPFGRDAGYPETVIEKYETIEDLAKHHKHSEEAKYYKLLPVNTEHFEDDVRDAKKRNMEKAAREKEENIKRELDELRGMLDDLRAEPT